MLHPSIVSQFKGLDHALSIGDSLRGCANIGPANLKSQFRGLYSEFLVVRSVVRRNGKNILLAHRQKTPFAEVDLIIQEPTFLRLVEVKSIGGVGLQNMFIETRVTNRQKTKLLGARLWAEHHWRRPVALDLVLVDLRGAMTWIPDFLS